jgi:hypothetical protein
VERSDARLAAAVAAVLAGLVIFGIIAGSQQSIMVDRSGRLPGVACPPGAETSDRSWIPDGYGTLVDPSCVAFRQTDNPYCAGDSNRHCVSYEFLARGGCPSALIANVGGYDANNERMAGSQSGVSRVQPGGTVELIFALNSHEVTSTVVSDLYCQ